MNNNRIILAILAAALLPLTLSQSTGGSIHADLTWKGSGTLVIKVFSKGQFEKSLADFCTGEAIYETSLAGDKSGKGSLDMTGIPPGEYAVSVYMDANGDSKLNGGPFGPAEPWGMSRLKNPPKDRQPRFNEVSFILAEGDAAAFAIMVK